MSHYDYTYKVVFLGDNSTGKTALAKRFCYNIFNPSGRLTIGVDFHIKTMEALGRSIKLQLWDFGGEERFRFLFPSYIRGSNGAIFMYDITNYGSLAHVDDWFEIVEKEIDYYLPTVFVGAKTDLVHLKEVSTRKAMELAINKGADGFIECSSKTGENVHKIFNLLTKLILKDRDSKES